MQRLLPLGLLVAISCGGGGDGGNGGDGALDDGGDVVDDGAPVDTPIDGPRNDCGMTDAECDASLEAWMRSRLGLRRAAFLALRNLCLLGYWSQPETWRLIGYEGPLLGAGAAG